MAASNKERYKTKGQGERQEECGTHASEEPGVMLKAVLAGAGEWWWDGGMATQTQQPGHQVARGYTPPPSRDSSRQPHHQGFCNRGALDVGWGVNMTISAAGNIMGHAWH